MTPQTLGAAAMLNLSGTDVFCIHVASVDNCFQFSHLALIADQCQFWGQAGY